MAEERIKSLNHFTTFSFTDRYWSLESSAQRQLHDDWYRAVSDATSVVHYYQTHPLERQADFMMWSALEVEDTQTPKQFFQSFTRATTPFRPYVRMVNTLWGMTKPSQYSRARSSQEMDPFTNARHPYLVIYPFTKTTEWYLKNQEARQGMMNEHIRIGKQYRDITQLLLYSFGLQDQEFVVVYETGDLARFSDLVHELRSTEGRRFTKADTPIHVGVYREPREPLALWLVPDRQ